MRPFVSLAMCFSVVMLPGPNVAAQGYAPWPPPPGMSAGEYAERYGHRVRPPSPQYDPGWDRDPQNRRGPGHFVQMVCNPTRCIDPRTGAYTSSSCGPRGCYSTGGILGYTNPNAGDNRNFSAGGSARGGGAGYRQDFDEDERPRYRRRDGYR